MCFILKVPEKHMCYRSYFGEIPVRPVDGDKQPEASSPHLVPLLAGLHSLLFPKGREMGRVAF